MKTLTVREGSGGRKINVIADMTYQNASGEWVAEVEGTEFLHACSVLCNGISDCKWENLHVQADQDDDGKEYKVLLR